jgi:hypothetical protein
LPPKKERAAFTARSTTLPLLFFELLVDFFELPPFLELPPAFFVEELDFFEEELDFLEGAAFFEELTFFEEPAFFEELAFLDELAVFDEPAFLEDAAFFEEALLAFFEELPTFFDEPPAFFDEDDELLAFFDELLAFFDEPPPFFEEPLFLELELAAAVSRETSLLKRFPSSSDSSSARPLRSNHSKNSSHSISSSVSSPLKPGKSMRRIPGSLPVPVAVTRAGCPPRASTHCRISSWSVVGCAVAIATPYVFVRECRAHRLPAALRICVMRNTSGLLGRNLTDAET